jgi:hypothetical protein
MFLSYDLRTLFLKHMHEVYYIAELNDGDLKILTFIRINDKNHVEKVRKIVHEKDCVLFAFTYNRMSGIIRHFTDKLMYVVSNRHYSIGIEQDRFGLVQV